MDNITSSIAEVGASKFECISTPWVRLFSRCWSSREIFRFGDSASDIYIPSVFFLQQMTETCSLAILTSFLFLRVHYALKFVISICVVAFYTWNVWVYRSNIFQVLHIYFSQKALLLLRVRQKSCTVILKYSTTSINNKVTVRNACLSVERLVESFHARCETGAYTDRVVSHVFPAPDRSSGKPPSNSRGIFSTLFVNEFIFTNIYSGRILEQAGLPVETSVNEGTGRSVSHEERQQAFTS